MYSFSDDTLFRFECLFKQEKRDYKKIISEYNSKKWNDIYEENKNNQITSEIELLNSSYNFCKSDIKFDYSSIEGKVYKANNQDIQNSIFMIKKYIINEIDKYDVNTVIELGAGMCFYSKLIDLHYEGSKEILSYDICPITKDIYKVLFSKNLDTHFNYYDEDSYKFLDKIENKCVIFSNQSIEQIKETKTFINSLKKYKDKIECVINFECLYELKDETNPIFFLQKKYLEKCDYNRDLYSNLKNDNDVEILDLQNNLIPTHLLYNKSIIKWKFK
tara:strand:+ start:1094 stop:1918 length:825 start_codon:yes stop_codon:yes gene_type:complete